MLPVKSYRLMSALQALAYLSLVLSLLLIPPKPQPGKTTVLDSVAGVTVIGPLFIAAVVFVLVTAAFRPGLISAGHVCLLVVVVFFGVANAGTSIENHSGWQIASLCTVAAIGHAVAIKRRPA